MPDPEALVFRRDERAEGASVNMIHGIEKCTVFFGTDCEYVTKCLCEKSLNKRRCISYPWRCGHHVGIQVLMTF